MTTKRGKVRLVTYAEPDLALALRDLARRRGKSVTAVAEEAYEALVAGESMVLPRGGQDRRLVRMFMACIHCEENRAWWLALRSLLVAAAPFIKDN